MGRHCLKIGDFIRRLACPQGIFTSGGLRDILSIKLFWAFGPQLMGTILGWSIGVHLLLMLFFGIPITSLGASEIKTVREENPVTMSERFEHAKKTAAFVDKMNKSDIQTQRNMHLMVAIEAGSVVTVEKLLADGVDVNTPRIPLTEEGLPYRNSEPMTPLWRAITRLQNQNEIALLLMKFGANVNARYEKMKGPTPLLYAFRNDVNSLIIPLIQYGAEANVTDVDGKTPLHHAADKNMPQVVQLLLERGAKFDVKDRFGHTPIDYAEGQIKTIIQQYMKGTKK